MQEKTFASKSKMDNYVRGKLLARVYREILSWRVYLEDQKKEPAAGNLGGETTAGSEVSSTIQTEGSNNEVNL